MRWMWTRAAVLGAIGLVAGGAIGCAEERAPINRVQANALAKSFFVGEKLNDPTDDPEFYAQTTVVDVGYGAGQDGLFTSTYAQPISRIKWTIQENLLIGRLTYERIANSDGKGAGKATDDGIVVAAYKIDSQFDIKRDYNPTTGEESNIVVENTTDRPWYEREYMRVDFSQNLNVDSYDFDTLSMIGVFGGVTYEPLAYYVNDPNNDDAPHFDPESGYFDVTNKAFATPQVIDLSSLGWGIDKFPACFLPSDIAGGSAPAGNCNPIELTLRQSFKRVVDDDYEPAEYDGYRFQAFGAFTTERHGFTRNYGMTDDQWHRFIDRYNIWEKSHYVPEKTFTDSAGTVHKAGEPIECFTSTPYGGDPHRDTDGDGTEDECQAVKDATGVNGSRCDTFKQKCTIPYQLRKEKSITWYYTNGSDPEFFDGTEWAAHEWDVAMRATVQSSKYAECVRGGATDCKDRFPMYFGQMDDEWDARELAREVDDCRHQISHPELKGSEKACTALADSVGAARGVSPGVIAIAKMKEMVVLCHSPVEANDPAQCAPEDRRLPKGMSSFECTQARKDRLDPAKESKANETLAVCNKALNVRRGDMRYNQINSIVEPQTPSPWGIMVDSDDPLTGEKVATSVNVWTYVNNLYSQSVIDQIRYINGELKTEDITDGAYIHNWAQAFDASQRTGAVGQISAEERTRRLADFAGVDAQEFTKLASQPMDASLKAKLDDLRGALQGIRAKIDAPTSTGPIYQARARQAIQNDPSFEAQLVTKEMKQYAGVEGIPDGDTVTELASPLRGANPTFQRNFKNLKEIALAQRGACMLQEAPAPFSMVGLGDILQQKFGKFNAGDSPDVQQARAEKMRQYIAQKAQYSVIAHEMGHSIGLRHNFISSYDAWGFRPQYWQLRTNDGQMTKACTTVSKDGEDCVGPRYFDPVNKNERDNLIWMWMQSSIMDYAGEGTQDMIGIGAYDYAAPRMFYGDVVSVHADPSYNASQPRGQGILGITDNFGGITGLQYTIGKKNIHYSQLQTNYDLIRADTCHEVDPNAFKPAGWNDARDGQWDPTVDGLIVKVNGKYTRCQQQPVDYEQWSALRMPTASEAGPYYRGGNAVDSLGRTRVPYGFATDTWADLGNLSVYRHDNGADAYELFNFLISQQELNHIFDNFRRGRNTFSVRAAADRVLERYNTKMRDGAKGLGLYANIFRDISVNLGYNFNVLWPQIIQQYHFDDNILAAGIAFDHFARQLDRPEPGEHFYPKGDSVLRSAENYNGNPGATKVIIPNGPAGYWFNGGDNVMLGGKPLENQLADNKGEYDVDYTMNAGSYYDKANAAMLLTESVDNFISATRDDFLDARYRSVSIADLFQDGYRRWLANNLTGDDFIKGPRLAADANGNPLKDADGFPQQGIGWTSWWSPTPTSCFPADGTNVCSSFLDGNSNPLNPQAPANVTVLDPEVGWEQQKFLIAWTLMYLPENAKEYWLNQMHIYELGTDPDPGFQNRIEFHDPTGKVYVARTYGKETIFGKTVQKGIGARVLEWANVLMNQAYETTPGPDLDGDTVPDWYEPVFQGGDAVVKYDPSIQSSPGCTANDNSQCTCEANRSCVALGNYTKVPAFMREAMAAYGLGMPAEKGIY